ncbi:hypothetical protein [Agrobacterium tumefaciens]|uniref:hypothetical protein n=1 Tax=Agrobacterium tumefaciens TaxID=358 RepID=UPI001110ABF6|nr:hypothetical protein [Agrobacterium tumefaciens]
MFFQSDGWIAERYPSGCSADAGWALGLEVESGDKLPATGTAAKFKVFGYRPSATDDPTSVFVFCLVATSGKSGKQNCPGLINQCTY